MCSSDLIGGLPAVLIAAFIVGSLPLGTMRWLVILVVVYTSTTMLRSGLKGAAIAHDTGAGPNTSNGASTS